MSTDTPTHGVEQCIERAAETVGPAWPLHSFVTANPLAGFEDRPFPAAVREGTARFGGRGYPAADVFRAAWEDGRIDADRLAAELADRGFDDEPERQLDRMASATAPDADHDGTTPDDRVDRVLAKWLAAFLDEGRAKWPMPNRDQGFYAAVRTVARHDREIPTEAVVDRPTDPIEAIETLLESYPTERWEAIFEHHLAALPGWTGFVKQRVADGAGWQTTNPITLAGYLAVRLQLADAFDATIEPTTGDDDTGTGVDRDDLVSLREAWLTAWESTYRDNLVEAIAERSADANSERPPAQDDSAAGPSDVDRPDAQLVFCIDTRSEIIRRHLEATGDYETHGYAGFFGVPMRYRGYGLDVTIDACPPIVDAQHRIEDRPDPDRDNRRASYDRWSDRVTAGADVLGALKSNAATAYSFVEKAGIGYGAALAARTLLPGRVYDLFDAADERVPSDHEFCTPDLDGTGNVGDLPQGLTLDEKVEYAAAAFDLMGWETFARIVVFTGHASQTANNPFDSSLDCGACAGNPGGPSARVLATICNEAAVRERLRERGIDVPDDTVFVAGEHNTTTDEVTLYDDGVPESHAEDVEQLRTDLATARRGATAERTESMDATAETGVREAERRAADWAQTRPEWGLAGNAAFVIGPRELTVDLDLDGRSFLHSYDWRTDDDGAALEAIMAGPMVVTQWINSQYYFATVDNGVYGSGSKITHNPVGNVGVYQGNGGDLMTGLPLQSLLAADDEPYHQPLRLSTVIHAPVERVTEILRELDDLRTLLDNDWLSLTVVDPEQDHAPFHYDSDLAWTDPRTDAIDAQAAGRSGVAAPEAADD